MTKITNLPRDLVEDVLSRIPLTSLRSIRSTCKTWNTLSKGKSFAKKHLGGQAKVAAKEKEFMMVMMMNYKVYLMRINLHNNVESCIKREAELISLDDKVDVSQVFHCDGLLLCITEDNTRLIVSNPYWGQTRWIKPTQDSNGLQDLYNYALGYEKDNKSCRSHKILRFIYHHSFVEFEIYDFNSDSWRVLDITPDWYIYTYSRGVSLKGNTYWYARNNRGGGNILVCFDFTRERFGLCLPLPFESGSLDIVSLSNVREEQVAVLLHCNYTLEMEIWVTTKIEPNAVSWNNKVFLEVNLRPFTESAFQFQVRGASFFIDEEKKVAVIFDKERKYLETTHNIAYIVGVDGTLKEADLGESLDKFCYPPVCSYVPSLVQL